MVGKPGMRNANRGKGRAVAWLREHASYQGDDCLPWPFSNARGGYGHFGLNNKLYRANRFMCELAKGPPPSPDHEAAHECGNECCVNPNHLSWKTHAENQMDRRVHGTHNKGRRWKLTPDDIATIRASTDKPKDLAARFGVGENNIRLVLSGKSWRDGQSLRLLTDDQVRAIRQARGTATMRELAQQYGVGDSVIWRIQSGKTYQHVP